MTAARQLPEHFLGDPRKPSWTYADLSVFFELSIDKVKRRMPEWEGAGFPCPLPYSAHPKRWRPAPVIAWAARHERRVGAAPLELVAIEGGARG